MFEYIFNTQYYSLFLVYKINYLNDIYSLYIVVDFTKIFSPEHINVNIFII